MVDPKKLLLLLKGYEKFKALTKAIQMVALSQLSSLKVKMNSRQYALGTLVPYFNNITSKSKNRVHALIAITVDKSCCGPHNNNILEAATSIIEDLKEKNKTIKLISVGQKSKFFFRKYYRASQAINIYNIDREPLSLMTSLLLFKTISEAIDFENIIIIFNRFYTAFTQKVSFYELCSFGTFKYNIMINSLVQNKKKSHISISTLNSIVETRSNDLYVELYEYAMSLFLLDALEENEYSALGARATAMNNATKNAGELIDKLRLQYNKARQEKITNESIEIVSCVNFVN